MPETKSTFENKDLPAELITIMSGTKLIRQIVPAPGTTVNLSITVTEITQQPTEGV